MEVISAFCFANARGAAKLAAVMANKGSLDGQVLLSEETWQDMMSYPKEMNEPTGLSTIYTQGGIG